MLIDDTSERTSDHTRGGGRGSFTLGEGQEHLVLHTSAKCDQRGHNTPYEGLDSA